VHRQSAQLNVIYFQLLTIADPRIDAIDSNRTSGSRSRYRRERPSGMSRPHPSVRRDGASMSATSRGLCRDCQPSVVETLSSRGSEVDGIGACSSAPAHVRHGCTSPHVLPACTSRGEILLALSLLVEDAEAAVRARLGVRLRAKRTEPRQEQSAVRCVAVGAPCERGSLSMS
jgi:hypothetical protein